jgi:hypothetical protein
MKNPKEGLNSAFPAYRQAGAICNPHFILKVYSRSSQGKQGN